MPEQATLHLQAEGDVEVELLTAFLSDFNRAYSSILLFERSLSGFHRSYWPGPLEQLESDDPTSFITTRDQLRLARVQLASPGFWEFIGALNPLEVLRKYLNDRHGRRQDRDFREDAEKRRLELENVLLENKVLAERIRLLKEMGVTDDDLAPSIRKFIEKPLISLGQYQDTGIIGAAMIKIEHGDLDAEWAVVEDDDTGRPYSDA